MMHHETFIGEMNYERYMDRAYRLMNLYGYNAVKKAVTLATSFHVASTTTDK